MDDIKRLAAELGCSCVQAYKMDARKAVATTATTATSSSHAFPKEHKKQNQQQGQQQVQHMQQSATGISQLGTRNSSSSGSVVDTTLFHSQQLQQASCSSSQLKQSMTSDDHEFVNEFTMPVAGTSRSDAGSAVCHTSQQHAQELEEVVNHPAYSSLSAKARTRLHRRLASFQAKGIQFPASAMRAAGLTAAAMPGFASESFDYILLDAPCSALGLRPRVQSHHTLPELMQTAAYQRQLIDTAVRLLKPGGCLVYSTCSINPGEQALGWGEGGRGVLPAK